MKKVIEQKNDINIKVDHDICEGRILVCSLVGAAYIEKSNAREVALAICPELEQEKKELEEINKKLFDALSSLYKAIPNDGTWNYPAASTNAFTVIELYKKHLENER